MTPRLIHDDPEKCYACPECDNVPIYKRTGQNVTIRGGEYVCYECNTAFDDPREREKKVGGPKPTGYESLTDGGVELREGETRDDSHARRNQAMIRQLREELEEEE